MLSRWFHEPAGCVLHRHYRGWSMNALEVRDLGRSFGGLQALQNVTLSIAQGERRVIIGTNGAGKTTLFNLLDGQIRPTRGEIVLFGEPITALSTPQRAARGLARTFQITSLFAELSVRENIQIAVQALDPCHFSFVRTIESYRHIGQRVEELLAQWQLEHCAAQRVNKLSYGVQRQLEVVMALASRPRVLLLDEPMAGLSSEETHLVTDIILALDRAVTVVMIEHDLAAAFRVADRVSALDQGQVVAEGPPALIRDDEALQRIYLRGGALGTAGPAVSAGGRSQ